MKTFRQGSAAGSARSLVASSQASDARLHLFMTLALIASIVVVATVLSMGAARAQSATAIGEPDAGLVLALMLGAIGVMGALSAAAVRFVGRERR